jgi:uncharacterized protein YjiS (DUF1127 family)
MISHSSINIFSFDSSIRLAENAAVPKAREIAMTCLSGSGLAETDARISPLDLACRLQNWLAKRRQRRHRRDRLRHLMRLDDHLLDDIGFDRSAIEAAAGSPLDVGRPSGRAEAEMGAAAWLGRETKPARAARRRRER